MQIVVVSYNAHRCIGRDGRRDPSRVARVLQPLQAQLIGLQELSVDARSGANGDQARHLAHALGLELVYGPTLAEGEASYGNALLSALPISTIDRIDLSVGRRRELRGALNVVVTAGPQPVRVVVTHLGLRWWERRRQLDRLASSIRDVRMPLIVLGDLNEWRPCAHRSFRRLDPGLGPRGSPPTFPAALPLLRLDRVLVRPKQALVGLDAVDTALSRASSDHLPLRAVVDFGRSTTP